MELGLILGRNLEKPGKRQNLGVFQGQILHFCRFPGFSRFSRFSRSPGNPAHVILNLHQYFDLDLEIYRLKLDVSRQAAGIFRTNWE